MNRRMLKVRQIRNEKNTELLVASFISFDDFRYPSAIPLIVPFSQAGSKSTPSPKALPLQNKIESNSYTHSSSEITLPQIPFVVGDFQSFGLSVLIVYESMIYIIPGEDFKTGVTGAIKAMNSTEGRIVTNAAINVGVDTGVNLLENKIPIPLVGEIGGFLVKKAVKKKLQDGLTILLRNTLVNLEKSNLDKIMTEAFKKAKAKFNLNDLKIIDIKNSSTGKKIEQSFFVEIERIKVKGILVDQEILALSFLEYFKRGNHGISCSFNPYPDSSGFGRIKVL
jgi:hypothetical protein